MAASGDWACEKADGLNWWDCEHSVGGSYRTSMGPEWCTDGGVRITALILSIFLGIPLYFLLLYL